MGHLAYAYAGFLAMNLSKKLCDSVNDGEACFLARQIEFVELTDQEVRSLLRRSFSLCVRDDKRVIPTKTVILLIKRLHLSQLFADTYSWELDALQEYYGDEMTDGDFASLIDPILLKTDMR